MCPWCCVSLYASKRTHACCTRFDPKYRMFVLRTSGHVLCQTRRFKWGRMHITKNNSTHRFWWVCARHKKKKTSKNRLDRLFNIWINPRAQLQHVNARTTRADQTRASALRVIESARAPPLTPFSVQGVTICITRTHSCETQSRLQGWIY